MLETARKNNLTSTELEDLGKTAYHYTCELRVFKLRILELMIQNKIDIHLTPTLVNDMVNELDEYLLVINTLFNNQKPQFHPIHHHLLWLPDAVGHAYAVSGSLDLVEKDIIKEGDKFGMEFEDLLLKSLYFSGYMRTNLSRFPALDRLNRQVEVAILAFIDYLENVQDLRMDAKLLGTIMPLMADHMSREECYYLIKLSESANIKRPDCDPTRHRVEA